MARQKTVETALEQTEVHRGPHWQMSVRMPRELTERIHNCALMRTMIERKRLTASELVVEILLGELEKIESALTRQFVARVKTHD